jgi:hypothetical protein
MDDLDLQLDAFASRLQTNLRRDLALIAIVPLIVGLLVGGLVGRATRPAAAPSIVTCDGRAHGVFKLDVGNGGVRMNLEGSGD